MWRKPARDYYIADDDLVGVFTPEAVGEKSGPDSLSYVVRKRSTSTVSEPVPFRAGTFAGRLRNGKLKGLVYIRTGETGTT